MCWELVMIFQIEKILFGKLLLIVLFDHMLSFLFVVDGVLHFGYLNLFFFD